MTLDGAIQSAMNGNFVSNNSFSSEQSMHAFNGDLFYEDGANLTRSGFITELRKYEWAKDGWYIKHPKEKVNKDKLKDMHNNNQYMLRDGNSYEDCIMNIK